MGVRDCFLGISLLVMPLSQGQASDVFEGLGQDQGASAPFSISKSPGEMEAVTNFVQTRNLENFESAVDFVVEHLQKKKRRRLKKEEELQLQTFASMAYRFLDKCLNDEGDESVTYEETLAYCARLMKVMRRHESALGRDYINFWSFYAKQLLAQEKPNSNLLMEEVKACFYFYDDSDRLYLIPCQVEWVIALHGQFGVFDSEFDVYFERAWNRKKRQRIRELKESRAQIDVEIDGGEVSPPPKRRWGNKHYRNDRPQMNNGRGPHQRKRSY